MLDFLMRWGMGALVAAVVAIAGFSLLNGGGTVEGTVSRMAEQAERRFKVLVAPFKGTMASRAQDLVRQALGKDADIELVELPEGTDLPEGEGIEAEAARRKVLDQMGADLLVFGRSVSTANGSSSLAFNFQPSGPRPALIPVHTGLPITVDIIAEHMDAMRGIVYGQLDIKNPGQKARANRMLREVLWKLSDRLAGMDKVLSDQEKRTKYVLQRILADTTAKLGGLVGDPVAFEQAAQAYEALAKDGDPNAAGVAIAALYNNMGVTLRGMANTPKGQKALWRSQAVLEAAADSFTNLDRPFDLAVAQRNLALALMQEGLGPETPQALEKSLGVFKKALGIFTRDHSPVDWALTQAEMGTAHRMMAERTGSADHMAAAVKAYEGAIQVWKGQQRFSDYLLTQTNLGLAFQSFGMMGSGPEALDKSLSVFSEAIAGYEELGGIAVVELTDVLNSAGVSSRMIGELTGDPEYFKKAARHHELAASKVSRADQPFRWAQSQQQLGFALFNLGMNEDGTSTLRRAVARFELALEVFDPRGPSRREFIETQNGLGRSLRTVGIREDAREALLRSAEVLESATAAISQGEDPLTWAMTQTNLGRTLREIGWRERETGAFLKALSVFTKVLEVYGGAPAQYATAQMDIGTTHRMMGERTGNPHSLEASVKAYDQALRFLSPERTPQQWANAQAEKGMAYQALAAVGKGSRDSLANAAAAFEKALSMAGKADVKMDWGALRGQLAGVGDAIAGGGLRSVDPRSSIVAREVAGQTGFGIGQATGDLQRRAARAPMPPGEGPKGIDRAPMPAPAR